MGSIVKEFPTFPGRARKIRERKKPVRAKPRTTETAKKQIFKTYILNLNRNKGDINN